MREPFLGLRDDLGLGVRLLAHRDDLLEPNAERHYLEATRVGERRAVPVHELAEAAGLIDDVAARLKKQVVRVRKDRLATKLADGLGEEGLDSCFGPDRNEGGGLDVAVRGVDGARPPERSASTANRAPGLESMLDVEAEVGGGGGQRGRGRVSHPLSVEVARCEGTTRAGTRGIGSQRSSFAPFRASANPREERVNE